MPNTVPEYLLPPSLAMKLMRTPPVDEAGVHRRRVEQHLADARRVGNRAAAPAAADHRAERDAVHRQALVLRLAAVDAERERVRAERAADVLVGQAARRQRDARDEHAEVEHVAAGRQALMTSEFTTVWRVVLCRSTVAASPETVMVSAMLPTLSSPFSVRVNEPVSSMSSCLTGT